MAVRAAIKRLHDSAEWSSAMGLVSCGTNISFGLVALNGSHGSSRTAVLAVLAIYAIAAGLILFACLVFAPGMMGAGRPEPVHVVVMPVVFLACYSLLLLLLPETRLTIEHNPEVFLAAQVARTKSLALTTLLLQAAVLAVWTRPPRQKSK